MTDPAVLPSLRTLFDAELARRLVELRRHLHRFPELSLEEHETAARLQEELARLEPAELSRVAETGVVARFRGRSAEAPVVALRGDIDALPIEEATGFSWASEHPGVMHACGHDVHATWAVGAAALLARQPAAGDVVVVLQPAEEIARGARAILESGALDGVSAIFGGHVDRRFAVGEVVADAGALAASADTFEIELTGRGAHGARPHESRDPIVGAAALVSELQTIVSRRLDPGRAGVVSVCQIEAGTAHNIIPETAKLRGTLRAMDPESRALLAQEVVRIAEATAKLHRLDCRAEVLDGTPPIVNPERPAGWARRAAESLLGAEAVRPFGLVNMAAEDFAEYMERMEGCFLRIGAREEGAEVINAHNPRFYAADGAIFSGAAVLAETARIASAELDR